MGPKQGKPGVQTVVKPRFYLICNDRRRSAARSGSVCDGLVADTTKCFHILLAIADQVLSEICSKRWRSREQNGCVKQKTVTKLQSCPSCELYDATAENK